MEILRQLRAERRKLVGYSTQLKGYDLYDTEEEIRQLNERIKEMEEKWWEM